MIEFFFRLWIDSNDTQTTRIHIYQTKLIVPLRISKRMAQQRSSMANHLVRVHRIVRFLTRNRCQHFANRWNSRRTSDNQQIVNAIPSHANLTQQHLSSCATSTHKIGSQIIKLLTSHIDPMPMPRKEHHMWHFFTLRQATLCLFSVTPELRQIGTVLARINAVLFFKFFGQKINQTLVKIFSAQLHISVSGNGCKVPVFDFQN